jgi:hypothetical protein
MQNAQSKEICFTINVVDEFQLTSACLRYLRRVYPEALVLLLPDISDTEIVDKWTHYEDERTRVIPTSGSIYAVENGGLVVCSHLAAFMETDAEWWFKIDPDTFVRRRITKAVPQGCFFGTIQTGNPRPSLQGGCIGGDRSAVERLLQSSFLRSPELLEPEKSWAGTNPILLKRASSGMVSFDFVHAWACEQVGVPLVDHPEIKSYWLGPPRQANRYAITHPHKNLDLLDPDAPDEVSPAAEKLRQMIDNVVPKNATVAVVSKGDDELLELNGRSAWHFPRNELGKYLGRHPADSNEAVRYLEAVRHEGANFLIFPEPSLWWLDYYSEFRRYLSNNYRLVTKKQDGGVIFDVR